MQGLNKIFLLGYLGHSPQVFKAKDGQVYASLSLATHRRRHSSDDSEVRDFTDWHYVRVWGKQAENCIKYLSKGQPVLVEGFLTQYTQVAQDGSNQRRIGITATRVDYLPRKKDASGALSNEFDTERSEMDPSTQPVETL